MADENAFVEQWVAEAHERARHIVQEISEDRKGLGKSKYDRTGKGKGSAAERAAAIADEVLGLANDVTDRAEAECRQADAAVAEAAAAATAAATAAAAALLEEEWVAAAHARARQLVQEVGEARVRQKKGKGKLSTTAERAATMANEVVDLATDLLGRAEAELREANETMANEAALTDAAAAAAFADHAEARHRSRSPR